MKNAMKYAVLALGPIVLAVGLWWSFRDTSPISSRHAFVNVLTGEVVEKRKGSYGVIPLRDDEGRPALWPAFRNDEGVWEIGEPFRPGLVSRIRSGALPEAEVLVDPTTFAVQGR